MNEGEPKISGVQLAFLAMVFGTVDLVQFLLGLMAVGGFVNWILTVFAAGLFLMWMPLLDVPIFTWDQLKIIITGTGVEVVPYLNMAPTWLGIIAYVAIKDRQLIPSLKNLEAKLAGDKKEAGEKQEAAQAEETLEAQKQTGGGGKGDEGANKPKMDDVKRPEPGVATKPEFEPKPPAENKEKTADKPYQADQPTKKSLAETPSYKPYSELPNENEINYNDESPQDIDDEFDDEDEQLAA